MSPKPRIVITYCSRCHWLLRSAWLAQELLSTFADDLAEVVLRPAEISGTFEIFLDEQSLWERTRDDGFPEAKILKQRVRNLIDHNRPLGHTDR